MIGWFSRKRRTRRDALRRRLEILEPRSLLSGQAAWAGPIKETALLSAATLAPLETTTATVAISAPLQVTVRDISLNQSGGTWLAFRNSDHVMSMKVAPPVAHLEVSFRHLRFENAMKNGERENSASLTVGTAFANGVPKILIAPYEGSLDYFQLPKGSVQLPGVAVGTLPDAGSHLVGSAPGRHVGNFVYSAINALTQAVAASESITTSAKAAASMTVAAVDARQIAAATAPSRPPAAPPPVATAPTAPRSPLSGSADGGFSAIGSVRGVHRDAADAVLDAEATDALTEAEWEWLNPEARTAELAVEDSPSSPTEVNKDLATASFDSGMISLPTTIGRAEHGVRGIVAAFAEAPIEMTATASVFQAFELGFDTPKGLDESHAPAGQRRSAAFVSLSGDAAAPEDSTGYFSQRVISSALVAMAGCEFLRRRRRNQPGDDVRA